MPRTATAVKVGKRNIELSNLKKVLFPDDRIIKAELIEYYLKVAPTLLRHVKGRPLSFVRYPDGISGEAFFQKNRQDWAPEWIDHVALGVEEKIDYVLATEEATLVWLANLACIEIHQMHCRAPHFDRPDYIVFDLDPPENFPFKRVVEIALDLRAHVESLGYHAFVKTTGGKGVHVVTPIEPKWGFDQVFQAASAAAKPFVESHGDSTTLHIKKEQRKGRVLVDIYRNRPSQTIVSAYSVRGRARAPVAMPLQWDQLVSVGDPNVFNLRTALEHLLREGDAWEAMGAYAAGLHTERRASASPVKKTRAEVPESLKVYATKRSFRKTPEPPPEPATDAGNAFVLHRHHASHLHYDLRLEREGALKSWAVPKGLPPRPGIKRLAVQTEDHPVSYLSFEGTIPKGEYGGGAMWIFASGKYEITKDKKDSFYFRLQSRALTAEYRLIHTKDKEWLLERLDNPQVDYLHDTVEPMLTQSRNDVPEAPDYLYEVKWDGIRAMVSLDEGQLMLRSRNQRDITRYFPELLIPDQAFRATCGLFDTEIVCLDPEGKPVFEHSVWRLLQTGESGIARAKAKHPAVCYVFDCLYLDGRAILNEPLTRRREWMADAIRQNEVYRTSESFDEGLPLFEAAKRMGLEGIMAKERDSPYVPGKRTSYWYKIKARQTIECIIIGYTRGKGDREASFGALHLARYQGERLKYMGKVGSGFDEQRLKTIFAEINKIKPSKRPVEEKPLDDAQSVWLDPRLVCEVRYASFTTEGTLREPVFVRMRPDLVPEDCRSDT